MLITRIGMGFLLVEDDQSDLSKLKAVLEPIEPVVTCARSDDGRALLSNRASWTAAFIAVSAPHSPRMSLAQDLRANHPEVAVMVLARRSSRMIANRALEIGAAYAVKPIGPRRIQAFTSRATLAGKVERTVLRWKVRYLLTDAEVDVLRKASLGLDRGAIAVARACSEQTVKKHAANLLRQVVVADSLHDAVSRVLREAALT